MIRKRQSILHSVSKKAKPVRAINDAASITFTNILTDYSVPIEIIQGLVMEANTFPAFPTMNIQLYSQVIIYMLRSNGTTGDISFEHIDKNYIIVLLAKNDNTLLSSETMLIKQRYYIEFLSYLKYINIQREKYRQEADYITQHMNTETPITT